MGANIKGAGTDVIRIKGVRRLHGTNYSIIPDQIEAGTFMEMNEALEAIARRVHETCGGSTRGMDEWIDNQEACTLMDVPPRKMLQLRRSGSIPYSYIDRKVYYKRQDIIRFMEAEIHRVTPQNRMI